MNNFSIDTSKSVLVVDDNGINRLLPGLILRPFGWSVYEVGDGFAALNFLKEVNISFLLLDLHMPGLGGMAILANLRNDVNFHRLKIIAYTAYASEEDVSGLIEIGFDAVLIKPLTSVNLLGVLTRDS